jgi:hypothetical protein
VTATLQLTPAQQQSADTLWGRALAALEDLPELLADDAATLPGAPAGIAAPQPLAPVGHKPPVVLPAQPRARIAAGQSQPTHTTPGGAPMQTTPLLAADPAGSHSSLEADARVARPIIPAARRGGGGLQCS